MTDSELSPRPSPSPDRRFARILKPTKSRQSDVDSSTGSLAPTESTSEQSGLRKSIDKGITHLKERARKDSDSKDKSRRGSNTDSRRKLSRLVPKRSRRKLRDADDDSESENSLSVGDGDGNGAVLENRPKLNLPSNNASNESFGRSAASSLLTEDSDPERPPSRPNLASRASHKGYLTFSSPLIAAETVDTTDPIKQSSHAQVEGSLVTSDDSIAPLPSLPIGSEEDKSPPHTRRRSPSKANTFPRQDAPRPAPASSSQPSIKVTTFPTDRPQTPSTYITPPTPILPKSPSPPPGSKGSSRGSLSLGSLPAKTLSVVPKDSFKHRRTRSVTSTSAKSAAVPPPLTPHAEEVKTPQGSVVQPSGSSGFFASVFSATQNAVTQLSNSFAQQGNARARSTTASSIPSNQGRKDSEEVVVTNAKEPSEEIQSVSVEEKEPAIATLGSGNLSLTHLGIADPVSDSGAMPTRPSITDDASRSRSSTGNGTRASVPAAAADDNSVAEAAVSAAYGAQTPSEKSVPVVSDSANASARPRSLSNLPPETTPQRSVTATTTDSDVASLRRAGSVRSRLSGRRIRHRNSSAAGGAIAAALAASHSTIANPSSRRPTGFAVANTKRNREFHKDFKSVPDDDHLIDDFSAALQKDILLHGRFYISEQHVCFASNILGWTTTLVINFDEVVAIEKKSTAMIFPNAIMIQTLHARNVFASFLNRDATYDLLIRIWRIGHPNLKMTENGTLLDETAADKQDVIPSSDSTGDSDEDSEDGDSDDDDFHDDAASSVARPPSAAPSENADAVRVVSKTSPPPTGTSPPAQVNGNAAKAAAEAAAPAATGGQDFPGPATHAITQCGDADTHYPNQCLDTTVPAPLGKIYSLMFGPESGKVMKKFLVDDQKSLDLQMEDDGKGLGENAKTASYSYIKPLGGSIGPKQTKCLVTANLDFFDLEKAVCVTNSTQTPDVPSGNVFVIKTRYCLMWGPGNSTRIIMNCACEWSGKSWLKGPIEKGANEGQAQFGKDLAAFFKNQVATKSPAKGLKGKGKNKKKKSSPDLAGADGAVDANKAVSGSQVKSQGGGLFGPVSSALGPVGDVIGPLLTPVGILGTLLAMVTILWMRQSFRAVPSATDPLAFSGLSSPDRLAAYEQLWRREENQLWEWLEDRIRLDDFSTRAQIPPHDDTLMESMNERQVDDAIRVTEERLQALKEKVGRKKSSGIEEEASG